MSLTTKNILVVLGSLLVGGIIGELVRLHEGLNRVGDILQAKLTAEKDSTFSKGFVTASLLFCVGPMTILGSIQDGLSGDYTLLATKSIQLNVLLPEELREIARKTLGLVRKVEQASPPLPFHEDALVAAAARSHGIPRLFNIICAKLLEQAVLQDIDFIDGAAFTRCYEAIQASISATVTPQMRSILSVAKNYGGFSSDMSDDALDKLGMTTFVELIPMADYRVANDLMVRQEYEGGVRYMVSDIAQKAAES